MLIDFNYCSLAAAADVQKCEFLLNWLNSIQNNIICDTL